MTLTALETADATLVAVLVAILREESVTESDGAESLFEVVQSTPLHHCWGQEGPTVSASSADYANDLDNPDNSQRSSHSGNGLT